MAKICVLKNNCSWFLGEKKIHNTFPVNNWSDLFCWFVFCTGERLCCHFKAEPDEVCNGGWAGCVCGKGSGIKDFPFLASSSHMGARWQGHRRVTSPWSSSRTVLHSTELRNLPKLSEWKQTKSHLICHVMKTVQASSKTGESSCRNLL